MTYMRELGSDEEDRHGVEDPLLDVTSKEALSRSRKGLETKKQSVTDSKG